MFLYIQTLPDDGREIRKLFIWCRWTEGIMDLQWMIPVPFEKVKRVWSHNLAAMDS